MPFVTEAGVPFVIGSLNCCDGTETELRVNSGFTFPPLALCEC